MKPGPDGNRDRGQDKTWLEVNGRSKEHRDRALKRREQRRRNREPWMFGKVNWDAYQHDQLYDMIMSAKPEIMSQRSDEWRKLANSIERTTGTGQRIMQDLLNAWRGSAAVAAAESNSRLMRWAGDASHTTTRIASGMADYTEAVVHAQHSMPEPGFADAERNFRNGYTVAGTGGPSTAILLRELLSDQLVSHEAARERKAEAVRVMTVYEDKSKDTHERLPDGYEPIDHAANPNQPADPQRPVWIDDTPPGDFDSDPTPGPDGSGVAGDVAGVAGDVDGDGIPDGTTPGGYAGSGTGPGQGFGTGAGAPGFGGAVGGVPGGGAAGGADQIRGGAGLAASAGGALAGAGGGRGGPMGGGFFPPLAGAGAQGEQDREHRIKYDDGMDLFDDLPPAYPPVFGG